MTALTPYVTKSTLDANPGTPLGYFQVRPFWVALVVAVERWYGGTVVRCFGGVVSRPRPHPHPHAHPHPRPHPHPHPHLDPHHTHADLVKPASADMSRNILTGPVTSCAMVDRSSVGRSIDGLVGLWLVSQVAGQYARGQLRHPQLPYGTLSISRAAVYSRVDKNFALVTGGCYAHCLHALPWPAL